MASPQSTTYVYNAFNQLLSSTGPGGTTTFAWDDNGNQTAKVGPSGTTGYVWDGRDRLVEVGLPGGGVSRFGYDAKGMRVATQDATGSKRILLDGMEELAEYSAGTSVARYDHDPSRIDALLGQQVGTTTVHAVADSLGSVYAITDAASSAVSRYSYDAFGKRAASAEAAPSKFGFTGRVHDTGDAMYFRERYYSPERGVFVSEDPVNLRDVLASGGSHADIDEQLYFLNPAYGPRYVYAMANPVLLRDPTGRIAMLMPYVTFGVGGLANSLELAAIAMPGAALPVAIIVVGILYYTWPDKCPEDCQRALTRSVNTAGDIVGRAYRYYLVYGDGDPTHYSQIIEKQSALQSRLRSVTQNCSPPKAIFWNVALRPVAHFPFPPLTPRL